MIVRSAATLFCNNNTSSWLLLLLLLASRMSNSCANQVGEVKIRSYGNATRPEANILQGRVQGINMLTHHNRTVFGFIGIPYAQPPIGDLRFRAPVPADPWNGTFDASREKKPCVQYVDHVGAVGNEDCLYLNVFTPQLPANDKSTLLPVMLYILGGVFQTENNTLSRFGPDFLLDADVVLVLPNFRVGVLGFLSTGDEVSPGNYGLKDIVRALEWVQESIQYLGGDPNRVTLFGGSSGAVSVHLLALSNLTNGLFHKYITQSGTALMNVVNKPREKIATQTFRLSEYLGCPTNSSMLLVDCLRSLNASQLVDTHPLFYTWKELPINVWMPTSEPNIEGALLTDTPVNLLAAGKIRDLPWLSSVNGDDGFCRIIIELYEDPDAFEEFLNDIDIALPIMLEYDGLVDDVPARTAALKSYYLNDLTAERSLLLNNMTQLYGDSLFIYPAYKVFRQQLALAKSPQYLGSFEYRGVFSHTYMFSGGSTEYTEVAHGDETLYTFKSYDFSYGPPGAKRTDSDWIMVDTMVQLWTSFAANGTPTTEDSISTVIWEPYSSLNNYLRIGNGSDPALEMKYDLHIERMRFWDELTGTTASSSELRNPLSLLSAVLCLCSILYFNCNSSPWYSE